MPAGRAPRIEVLVGMIASGKSFHARQRADEGALVVCHDDLTAMLHKRYRYEPGLRVVYGRMMKLMASEALAAGRDVVIDRTHLTIEARSPWIGLARRNDYCTVPIIAVVFPIFSAEYHARWRFESDARGRSQEEWLAVARNHFGQAMKEPVSAEEGFDDVIEIENGSPFIAI